MRIERRRMERIKLLKDLNQKRQFITLKFLIKILINQKMKNFNKNNQINNQLIFLMEKFKKKVKRKH